MRPVTVIASGVSASNPVILDYRFTPFNVSVAVKTSGTITYTVQHTFDDPFGPNGLSSATWFDNDDPALVGATSNQAGNYAFPVRAIRVNNTAGTGSTTMIVIQASGK